MKIFIVTQEYDSEDDGNREHSLEAAFSTLEAAQAFRLSQRATVPEWMHLDIQALEVDAPDQPWEHYSDPRCSY